MSQTEDLDIDTPAQRPGMPAIRRYPRYPAYKPSGVEWLGEVPEDWGVVRLRHVASINPAKSTLTISSTEIEASFVPMEAIGELGGMDLAKTRLVSEVQTGYTCFRDDDVVVAKITPCFENGKGALAKNLTNGIGFGTTELHVIRPSVETDARFLFYLTLSRPFRDLGAAEMYGAGGQKRVPDSFVQDFRVALPSLPEQRAIATFLDRKTAAIDEVIRRKERQIELLREKRQATISRAVTKGLNPNAKMKASGVEWLGEVPEGWEVKSLKTVLESLNTKRIPLSSEERADRAKIYPYYGASGIIDYVDDFLFEEPLILVAEDGANLYSRSTPLAFVADGKYWVNNHAHILRPRVGPLEYWANLLTTIVFDPWITGSAQPKLTKENLGSIMLPVPPELVRRQIVTFIQSMDSTLIPVTQRVEAQIDRLRELRQALISATVNGSIDVRHCVGVQVG